MITAPARRAQMESRSEISEPPFCQVKGNNSDTEGNCSKRYPGFDMVQELVQLLQLAILSHATNDMYQVATWLLTATVTEKGHPTGSPRSASIILKMTNLYYYMYLAT